MVQRVLQVVQDAGAGAVMWLLYVYLPWWALLAVFLGLMALFWKYEIQVLHDDTDTDPHAF